MHANMLMHSFHTDMPHACTCTHTDMLTHTHAHTNMLLEAYSALTHANKQAQRTVDACCYL